MQRLKVNRGGKMRILRLIRSWFCEHEYGNGKPCPFIDEYGNHSAVYVCEKCGRQKLVTFHKK